MEQTSNNSKARIITPRYHFKGEGDVFEYPEYVSYWIKCVTSVWNPFEPAMDKDVRDWNYASEQERAVIAGILRGFTQTEVHIGDYWSDVVAKLFPKFEVVSTCRMFAAFETIHAFAYNHLSSTLGLDDYAAFESDPEAKKKVSYFINGELEPSSLAIFSGAGEGISLFCSFAILLSFCREGRFKAISEILSWSLLDEAIHSEVGCKLFSQWISEDSSIVTEELCSRIRNGFQAVIDNEISFLRNIFANGEINGLRLDHYEAYMYKRANNRIEALSLKNHIAPWEYDTQLAKEVSEWFDPLISGNISNDFFAYAKEGANYIAKASVSIEERTMRNAITNYQDTVMGWNI